VSSGAELSVAAQNLLSPAHVEFGHAQAQPVGIARSLYVEVRWRRSASRP